MNLERYIDCELPWLGNSRWAFPVEGALDELVAVLLMLGCEKVESEYTPGEYSVYPPSVDRYGGRVGRKLIFFEPGCVPDPSINVTNLTEFLRELEKNDGP